MTNMDIPHRAKQGSSRPNIFINETSDRSRTWSRSNSSNSDPSPTSNSIPLSIPGARNEPPPPLPPPRQLENPNLAWELQNRPERGFEWDNSSIPQSSSLYGSSTSGLRRSSTYTAGERDEHKEPRPREHRESSNTTLIGGSKEGSYPKLDEGYNSFSSLSSIPSQASFKFSSSVHDKFQPASSSAKSYSAKAYDQSLLSKLDARRGSDNGTPPRTSSMFSSSANDPSTTSRIALDPRFAAQLKPLSLPTFPGRSPLNNSPSRRWDSPSAMSPHNHNIFSQFGGRDRDDDRSPCNTAESDRSPRYCRRPWGSGSTNKSDEQRVSPDSEETGLRRLHIEDYSSRSDLYSPGASIGQKRRAESPLGDEGPPLHAPRYYPHSHSGSISSTASAPRSNSYASSLSIAPSSITSAGSYGRISPGGVSPRDIDMLDSPYLPNMVLNPSPRGSIPRSTHQRALSSETRPMVPSRISSECTTNPVKGSTGAKIQGVFLCECCPKKPKKFDSQEELSTHEQEKQYECAYCRNRFKNKNEAERHQNSLHLRRQSWSCAALNGYADAFHTSPNRPGEADTCGYCGEDFPRSGMSSPSIVGPPTPIATDHDWDVRIGHLQESHKFGECNHAKKFFRADHFRQHLKHSHAGTSGKWTNQLENSCMKDEPIPEIRQPKLISPGGSRVSRISEEDESPRTLHPLASG